MPHENGNFEGESAASCKVQGRSAVSCAKTAEPIETRVLVVDMDSCGPKEAYVTLGCTLAPPGEYD